MLSAVTQRGMDLRERLTTWEIPAHAAYSPDRLLGSSPNGLDMFVRYDLAMSGAINQAEWRAFLRELLAEMPGSPLRRKEPLARKLGISVRQLTRWLDPEYDGTVTEASVRQVAERSGRNVAQLFTRLGYLEQPELPYPPEDAWIVEVIMASKKLSADAKSKMIAVQLAQAKRDREERRRRINEAIEMVEGEVRPPAKRGIPTGVRKSTRTEMSNARTQTSSEIKK